MLLFFFRFIIEFIREPDIQIGLLFNFISMGQLLCVPVFIIGFIIIQYHASRKNN